MVSAWPLAPSSSARLGHAEAPTATGREAPLFGIQALRAIAALMVAVHHARHDAAALGAGLASQLDFVARLPWMAGVDIFFVVSGFIMVHSSVGLVGPAGAGLFLRRRLARVVPLYWTATTLLLIVGLLAPAALNSGSPDAAQVIGSYLFWPVVSTQGQIQPVFSLGWTLNYEMLFYGVFALGLLLPGRLGLALAMLVLVTLVAGERLAGPWPLPFGFWGQPIVLEFAAGMGIALLRRRQLRLSLGLRIAFVLAGVGVLVFAGSVPDGEAPWTSLFLRGGAACLLVLAAGCGERRTTPPGPLLRGMAGIGDASYALYLVHPFIIRGLREVAMRLGLGAPLVFIGLALVGSVVAALLVHQFYEKPVTRLLRRHLRA